MDRVQKPQWFLSFVHNRQNPLEYLFWYPFREVAYKSYEGPSFLSWADFYDELRHVTKLERFIL
jgi:hypothetical protein